MHMLFFFFSLSHKVLYSQQMKFVSGERVDISGIKLGSILIMHSSSSEYFRTGGEGDGVQLQIGAGKEEPSICLQAPLSAPG